jgi:hypothetical protein
VLTCFSCQKEFHGALFRDEEVAFVFVYERPEAVLRQDYEAVAEAVAQRNPAYCVPRGGLLPVGKYPGFSSNRD